LESGRFLKRLFVFKLLNIAVLVAALIFAMIAANRADSFFDRNIVYMTPIINDNRFHFSVEDISQLKERTNAERLAVKTISSGFLRAGYSTALSRIIYTNSDYFSLRNFSFLSGGGWTLEQENANVIVLNDIMAWRLFGSNDVVGKEIFLFGEFYTIIGVVEQENARANESVAYIPLNPAIGARSISSVLLQPSNYERLGANNNVRGFLRESGRNERDYYITDLSGYISNIVLNFNILLFIVGVYLMVVLILNFYKLLRHNPINKKTLPKLAVLLVVVVIGVVLAVRIVSFDFWLPHSGSGRVADVINALTNSGNFPSDSYLCGGLQALVGLNRQANIALVAGLIAFTNFVFVHKS
jgi:hypothetical protein